MKITHDPATGDRWYSMTEAIEKSGLGRGQIRTRIENGTLKTVRISSRGDYRIYEKDLDAMIREVYAHQ